MYLNSLSVLSLVYFYVVVAELVQLLAYLRSLSNCRSHPVRHEPIYTSLFILERLYFVVYSGALSIELCRLVWLSLFGH